VPAAKKETKIRIKFLLERRTTIPLSCVKGGSLGSAFEESRGGFTPPLKKGGWARTWSRGRGAVESTTDSAGYW